VNLVQGGAEGPSIAPGPAGVTLEQGVLVASERAQGWADDAVLLSAGAQVDWPLTPAEASVSTLPAYGWVTVVLLDTDHGGEAATLSLRIDRYGGTVTRAAEVRWEDAPGGAPLPLAEQPVSSTVALETAEREAGRAFRMACPAQRHESRISLVTGRAAEAMAPADSGRSPAAPGATPASAPAGAPVATAVGAGTATPDGMPATPNAANPAPAVWLVTYRDDTAPGELALAVRIDAATGRVLAVEDGGVRCEAD
jgi:hypothetical protein